MTNSPLSEGDSPAVASLATTDTTCAPAGSEATDISNRTAVRANVAIVPRASWQGAVQFTGASACFMASLSERSHIGFQSIL
jgi:hypothetical protein